MEHCPAGALTYQIEGVAGDIEVDLPSQVAVTIAITSLGHIAGALWATGGTPILRSDGRPLECRNRVTLCNCGHSSIKPLCDN